MHQHAFLRAYMAGIVPPTIFLLLILAFFIVSRLVYHLPVPIERVIVFPMAVVPNLWGLWNMLYVALRRRRALPIGFHGALLVCILVPLGYLLAHLFGLRFITVPLLASLLPFGMAVYYLAWKYLVGSVNAILGIA